MNNKLLKESIINDINNIGIQLFNDNKFNDFDNKKFVNLINHICYKYYKSNYSYGLDNDDNDLVISEKEIINSLFINIKNNFYGNFLNKKIKYYYLITENQYSFKKHYNIPNSIFTFNYNLRNKEFNYFISKNDILYNNFINNLIDKIINSYSCCYKNINHTVYFKNDNFYFNKYLII